MTIDIPGTAAPHFNNQKGCGGYYCTNKCQLIIAGAWIDLPTIDEIRQNMDTDNNRKKL